MPEVNEEPYANQALSQTPALEEIATHPELSADEVKTMAPEKLRRILLGVIAKDREDHPEQTARINAVAVSLFGPLILKPEVIESAKTEEAAVKNARLQHTLIHNLYYATRGAANPEFVASVFEATRLFELLSQNPAASDMRGWWNGIRVNLGVLRMFKEKGFQVFLPNYSQRSDQVHKWDVRGGIDFLVTPRNEDEFVVGIDAKSRRFTGNQYSASPILELPPRSPEFMRLDQEFQKTLLGGTGRPIYTLVINMNPDQIAPLNLEIPDPKVAMASFGYLNPTAENGIMNRFRSIPTNRSYVAT